MKKIQKIIWAIKQLVPLPYSSKFSIETGEKYQATWRMWLGKVYDCEFCQLV